MPKEIVEVPVLSQAVRNVGVPLSLVTKANGFVFVASDSSALRAPCLVKLPACSGGHDS